MVMSADSRARGNRSMRLCGQLTIQKSGDCTDQSEGHEWNTFSDVNFASTKGLRSGRIVADYDHTKSAGRGGNGPEIL
jgi:hypothetical protein